MELPSHIASSGTLTVLVSRCDGMKQPSQRGWAVTDRLLSEGPFRARGHQLLIGYCEHGAAVFIGSVKRLGVSQPLRRLCSENYAPRYFMLKATGMCR